MSFAHQPLRLFDEASGTCSYLLIDEATHEALIIDPVDAQIERDLAVLRERGVRLAWSVETHAHADHVTAAGQLAEHAGAHTAAPAGCGIGTVSRLLQDGELLTFGGETLTAIHTPGHTAGSMCYRWRKHLFTGDTLLIGGCGRTDFQSGSAEALYDSITQRLFTLPDETIVWPGHDYRQQVSSTIGAERLGNPRLAGKTRAEFAEIMAQLKLARPARMDEAVPANLRSGLRHDADAMDVGGIRSAQGYAGDLRPELACDWWQHGVAVLVDVRTDAEREWVGFVPGAAAVAWKQWPGMALNAGFDTAIRSAAGDPPKPVLLMCRSGVRSIAAARRATELGLVAYNILEGFEGDPDDQAHRGRQGGWRKRGLPWRQN